ncbi:hypothetical protein [Streptomyces sp. NPDC046332]|uniref:hypothetical protein n=1 Tax=unclassified Streptomyces TaxID=2593676 RepID=UPI0033CFEC7C
MADEYPWVRRESERGPAYAAFREYLNLGPRRTIKDAAAAAGISFNSAKELYARHDWQARAVAYDQHLDTAATDGLANQLAENRDKNLALVDKLRTLLDARLDDFIAQREDPTIRWTQALAAMTKLEGNAFLMKDDPKTSERVERIESLVEEFLGLDSGSAP